MTKLPADPGIELEPYDSPNHPLAPWFHQFRRERRAHRLVSPASGASSTRAIVTMVHNEPVFLPIWLAYYSRFFAADDIYVLDNDSTDGSTRGTGFVRIPVVHDSVDHSWMVQTMQALQHQLLKRYRIVVVTDVDEIIAPIPGCGGLGAYLDEFGEEWVNCLGYELLHLPEREPTLDLSRPVLRQRRCWFHNGAYDKAAIATVPVRWRPGFHGREDFQCRFDPDLRLIHLHRMDYGICLARHRTRARRRWAERDAAEGWAAHNQIVDEAAFARWFTADTGFAGFAMQREEIHPAWRGLV